DWKWWAGSVDETELVGMFFFSSRRRHTRLQGDWSSDVCSSDLHLLLDLADLLDGLLLGLPLLREHVGLLAQQDELPFDLLQPLLRLGILVPPDTFPLDLELRSEERRVGKECRSVC